MASKPLVWLDGEIKTPPFSSEARLEAGFLLRRLQLGQALSLHVRLARSGRRMMDKRKKAALEASGWKVGDAREFLGLSDDEAIFIEMKLALAEGLRALRLEESLTQEEVARLVGSSQSRIAKMEVADASVTMDLLVRTLLRLGAGQKQVAELVGHRRRQKAAV